MNNVHEMKRIFENPSHPLYGPTRRLWMMLEQLFADQGGIGAFEARIKAYQSHHGLHRPRWDEHFAWLVAQGQPECSAQRTVVQQMIVALEFIS